MPTGTKCGRRGRKEEREWNCLKKPKTSIITTGVGKKKEVDIL